jgi:hypothetical protein
MLDKGQIKDWDGEPDPSKPAKPATAIPVKPEAPAAPIASSPVQFGEALPTGERIQLTPEQAKARKRRGQWLALGLFAFVIVIFALTMTKMGANIMVRDL